MSFLDDLENNLKSLESSEQGKDDAERAHRMRESERAQAQAVAPYAEQLKKSPFTAELLTQAARVGFSLRTKVHIAFGADNWPVKLLQLLNDFFKVLGPAIVVERDYIRLLDLYACQRWHRGQRGPVTMPQAAGE